MLGINYESSDEEDAVPVAAIKVSGVIVYDKDAIATNIELPISTAPQQAAASKPAPAPAPIAEKTAPLVVPEGPAQGPTVTLPEVGGPDDEAPPGSPYTSSRLMIQNLTLPTNPNLNIPPSPPGSPPQRSTRKFAQFLELKKNGQHFNQRLETSSVVRDPNHLNKLMGFAGITEDDQYASTLSEDLGVPAKWPEWAYGDSLNASQKKVAKAKESERSRVPRESVDFVPARSGASSSTGTPSSKGGRQSAAERVMAGLDKRPRDRR